MEILRLLLPAMFVLLAFACKNDPKNTANSTASTLIETPMPQKVVYICPMDCEKGKTYDQPGQCPVCKMDLEPANSEQLRHATTEIAAAAETTGLPATDPNKTLEEEVNALHDEVMKESSEMVRVGRQIKEEFKTVQGAEKRKAYTKAIAEISRAGFDMMAWMRDYRAPDDLSAAEATRYLKAQKTKMLSIRAAVQKALAEGKGLPK
ncbi:MAG: hypothetical protein LH618_10190 [Saprospiraceae bacterium]|nr:hypothetical protein [Saprospiraceae bacterium]